MHQQQILGRTLPFPSLGNALTRPTVAMAPVSTPNAAETKGLPRSDDGILHKWVSAWLLDVWCMYVNGRWEARPGFIRCPTNPVGQPFGFRTTGVPTGRGHGHRSRVFLTTCSGDLIAHHTCRFLTTVFHLLPDLIR